MVTKICPYLVLTKHSSVDSFEWWCKFVSFISMPVSSKSAMIDLGKKNFLFLKRLAKIILSDLHYLGAI
ncbi:hypothetical protein BpHYR1_027676 [Brachionus plicatilis]|uniref:Uncharacterized protein n=1 Tax=Brachionus plicatilis TaxID=10195 RepID=A0A3M7QCH7_BRAPC|nr:hypothetical protein BpHYR1_027676 [Brachionus plicatilis]